MKFKHTELQKHVDRAASLITGLPDDERPVFGLMDAWYWFRVTQGEESPIAAEAVEFLLSTDLRQPLRNWYRRCGENMNPAAIEFRDSLSRLAGERFG